MYLRLVQGILKASCGLLVEIRSQELAVWCGCFGKQALGIGLRVRDPGIQIFRIVLRLAIREGGRDSYLLEGSQLFTK